MVKSLNLKYFPDPILRQKTGSTSVEQLNKQHNLSELLLDMEKTMDENNGIGIAAPQIGKSIRVAIVRVQDGILPLINPKITWKSFKKEVMEEGCLSIPKVFGDVKRSLNIRLINYTPEGKKIRLRARGMLARVIQHEVDHLDGVLFIDRATEVTSGQSILKEMEKNHGKK